MRAANVERLNSLIDIMPFILTTAKDIKMSGQRIMEGVIIALVTGALCTTLTYIVLVKVTEERVNSLRTQISALKEHVDDTNDKVNNTDAKIDGIYRILIEQAR